MNHQIHDTNKPVNLPDEPTDIAGQMNDSTFPNLHESHLNDTQVSVQMLS
jgi:hypothetical protein